MELTIAVGMGMTRPKELQVPTKPDVAADEGIGEIRNIVGFHIRLAHGAVYRHFTEGFERVDLLEARVLMNELL